jgi:hypothetical protein
MPETAFRILVLGGFIEFAGARAMLSAGNAVRFP